MKRMMEHVRYLLYCYYYYFQFKFKSVLNLLGELFWPPWGIVVLLLWRTFSLSLDQIVTQQIAGDVLSDFSLSYIIRQRANVGPAHRWESRGSKCPGGVYSVPRCAHRPQAEKWEKQPSPGRWRKLSQQLRLCSLFHLWVFHFILFFAFSVLCCWIYCMCLSGEFKEGTTERARISGVDMKAKWWEEVGDSIGGSGKHPLPGFGT